MGESYVTIPLDPQTARTYDSAAPEQKGKIQALLRPWSSQNWPPGNNRRSSKCSMTRDAGRKTGANSGGFGFHSETRTGLVGEEVAFD
jgi:hypothetical protein